jgi:hypothetical protein
MPIENISDLEKSLHLESGSLSKALESEESIKIEIPELKILKTDDYDSLISNVKSEASKQGIELMLKDLKETEGLEYEGRKKPENFINALKEKVRKEAGEEPEKKYKDLKTSFGKLQENFQGLETLHNNFKKDVEFKQQKNNIDAKIMSEIPDNLTISKEDALSLFNLKNKASLNDEGNIVFMDGETVRKNEVNQNPMTPTEVMETFITPYIKQTQGGAGGTDTKGTNAPTGMESFIKEMETKGVKQNSADFSKELRERMSAGTLKI